MISAAMKKLSPKQVLAVRCPTCSAKPGEKCQLATGLPRINPHRDRRVIAKELHSRLLPGGTMQTLIEDLNSATEFLCTLFGQRELAG
jgi:hypothetical protein